MLPVPMNTLSKQHASGTNGHKGGEHATGTNEHIGKQRATGTKEHIVHHMLPVAMNT